jgi:hypothetical protein
LQETRTKLEFQAKDLKSQLEVSKKKSEQTSKDFLAKEKQFALENANLKKQIQDLMSQKV